MLNAKTDQRRCAMRVKHRDGSITEEPENQILQDGETMIVPTMMLDSLRREIAKRWQDSWSGTEGQSVGGGQREQESARDKEALDSVLHCELADATQHHVVVFGDALASTDRVTGI